MNIVSLILDLFTPVVTVIGVIWYFATKGSKQDELHSSYTVLVATIKENHDNISKKIELASLDASRMRTEVELMKLRVDILERESDKNRS